MKKNNKVITSIFAILIFSSSLSAQITQNTKQDALVLYHNGKYKESIAVCEEEIKDNPNRIESYVVMCWSLVRNKQYAEAEERANQGLKISPYDLRLIEILGEAKYYLGKNSGAMEQFQRYVSGAPESGARVGVSYYYMGEIFIRQARYQHADIALSSAVKKEPLLDSWWVRLGYAREMAKNYKEAIVAYDEALKLNSASVDAYRGRERVSAKLQ
ncbi:MAG: tetratricopeptide repeat protein [Treponema sp.]|nr:tetratricopeptide repeat protein [Treponema sp.]